MAAYPSIRQDPSTVITPQDSNIVDVSDSGDVRAVAGPPETVSDISLYHLDMLSADKEAVELFYSNNYDSVFTFTYAGDSTAYNATFVQEPTYTWADYDSWDITVSLVGVKQ